MRWFGLCFVAWATSFASTPSCLGKWKTFDDETGQAKSIVTIFQEGGEVKARIDSLLLLPGEDPSRVCVACSGDRKGKRIWGMVIAWGLKPQGNAWEDGHILDPKNGKTYKCKLIPNPDGKHLTVRGFIGFSLLGRSQIWERA